MRKNRKEETSSSLVLLPPTSPPLHPLTLSDRLHLIPSSLVYRLLPPGTVQKFVWEYLVKNLVQTLCKLSLLNTAALVFVPHIKGPYVLF